MSSVQKKITLNRGFSCDIHEIASLSENNYPFFRNVIFLYLPRRFGCFDTFADCKYAHCSIFTKIARALVV